MTRQPPTQYDLEKRWITAEGIPGVIYRFSDLARIKHGERLGQTGVVVALIRIDPEPTHVLELFDGKSIVLSQRELDPTSENAGRTLILVKAE